MSILDFRWKKKPKPSAPVPAPVQPPDPPLIEVVPVPVVSSRRIRVTDDRDGEILNRGYAYWSQCHVEPDGRVLVFVGHTDGRPKFFRVNLSTGHVERLGALLGGGD